MKECDIVKICYTKEQIDNILNLLNLLEVRGVKNITYLASIIHILDKGQREDTESAEEKKAE